MAAVAEKVTTLSISKHVLLDALKTMSYIIPGRLWDWEWQVENAGRANEYRKKVFKEKLPLTLQHCITVIARKNELTLYASSKKPYKDEGPGDFLSVLPCNYDGEFAVTVELQPLLEIVSVLQDGLVRIDFDGKQFKFVGKKQNFEFPVAPFNSQSLPNQQYDVLCDIPAPKLLDKIMFIQHAVAREAYQGFLRGAHVVVAKNEIVLEASDHVRLSQAKITLESNCVTEADFIIRRDGLRFLQIVLTETNGNVQVSKTVNSLCVKWGDNKAYFELFPPGSTYPNTQRVIPKKFVTTVSVDRQTLLDATNRALILAKNGGVNTMELHLREQSITLLAENIYGRSSEKIPATGDTPLELKINGKYLLDALQATGDDVVTLQCSGVTSPELD